MTLKHIPGVKECRDYQAVQRDFPTKERIEVLHTLFQDMVTALLKMEDIIWPFEQPVSEEEVPDYRDVVKDPVDLSLIQKRLDSKCYYITEHIFFADIRRMLENCKLYNNASTLYYQHAESVEKALCERGWEKYFPKKK